MSVTFLVLAALVLTCSAVHAQPASATAPTTAPATPAPMLLAKQRADPFVVRHTDGFYYFTATAPEYDRLVLRRSPTVEGLTTAEEKVIWRKHEKGIMGAHIWAPEIHFIDGKWFIYFAAGEAEQKWNIRMYVLENTSPNPLEGEWVERGQIKTKWESFSLDATTFEHRGTRYLAWAQRDPSVKNNTDVYLAKMSSPTTIVGEPVRLTRPELPWETRSLKVNEGPAVLIRNGRVFMAFSANRTDADYAMGLLTADENADLLDAKSWKKSPEAVFKSSERAQLFGPGHNSFTTTPDGRTDLLVYHARDYEKIDGDPLRNPDRHARVQPFTWNADGTPNFGEPVK